MRSPTAQPRLDRSKLLDCNPSYGQVLYWMTVSPGDLQPKQTYKNDLPELLTEETVDVVMIRWWMSDPLFQFGAIDW